MNKRVRELVAANGGTIVGEEYFPLDHMEYGDTVRKIMASGADVVFNTIVPPGLVPFFQQLHDAGFTKRGGQLVCTYFDENLLALLPPEQTEGLYGCLDYYQNVTDPFSKTLLDRYNARFTDGHQFTGGSACSGLYRAIKLWEAAVTEAGSLRQDDVIAALDHAKIARRPRRSGRDGARPAPCSHEHVHRAGEEREIRDREEPRRHRSERGDRLGRSCLR